MKAKLNNIKYALIITVLGASPVIGLAQAPASDIKSLISFIAGLFQNILIPMMISLALIYVMVAVIQYIGANQDPTKRQEKKQQIFWGLMGLFVILSIWSLVSIVQNTFRIFSGGTLQ